MFVIVAVKQERPPIRVGAHPAMRERGRAIPPTPPGTPPKPVALPPHVRVRSLSPLSVYYDLDIKVSRVKRDGSLGMAKTDEGLLHKPSSISVTAGASLTLTRS